MRLYTSYIILRAVALNIIMDSNDIVKYQLNKLEQILVPLSCIFVFLKNNVKISHRYSVDGLLYSVQRRGTAQGLQFAYDGFLLKTFI